MSSRIGLLVVLVAALAVVPAALADPVDVAAGDTIDVINTNIGCLFSKTGTVNEVDCYLANHNGVIPGTFGVELSGVGRAVVRKVTSKRTTTLLWQRTVASARKQAGNYYQARPGDVFIVALKVGYLGCKVLEIKTGDKKFRGVKIACWRQTVTSPFPNTYGVVLANKFAGSFKFDANGKTEANTFIRFQPKN